MRKISLLIFSLLVLVLFTSCGGGSSSNNNDDSNAISFYLNSNPFEDDNIKLEVVEPMCYDGEENYTVVFGFNVTNKTNSKQTYKVKDVSLKNSKGKKSNTIYDDLDVEAGSSDVYFIYGNTATDIKDDKYQASFKFGNYSINYYLYDKNNNANQSTNNNESKDTTSNNVSNITIEFYIIVNSKLYLVNEASVKSGSSLPTYVYEDIYTYNDTWYSNSSCTQKITSGTAFTSDQNVYGVRKDNFDYAEFSNYYQINGVKHVPSNGILVIPNSITTEIFDMGNKKGIKSIYVPKTTRSIDRTAFDNVPSNATIYYAGTEAEWKSLFFTESYAFTTNVVFNTPYSA